MNIYRQAHNAACAHLINKGPWRDAANGRRMVAHAILASRRERGRADAVRERYHLSRICGCLPVKPSNPLAIS